MGKAKRGAVEPFSFSTLRRFKAANSGRTAANYPSNLVTLYSPVDDVPGALLAALKSAQQSIFVAQYGFDDQRLADVLKEKLADPAVFVQLTLDKSQAGGAHEKTLLQTESYPASSIAVGHSERGAIQHLKLCVIDGWLTVTGSTNWSVSGETLQDNTALFIDSAAVAAEAVARVSAIHANMLQQMARAAKS